MAARIADTVRGSTPGRPPDLRAPRRTERGPRALRLASHALRPGGRRAITLHGPADELAGSDEVRRRYLGVVDGTAAAHATAVAAHAPVLRKWGGDA